MRAAVFFLLFALLPFVVVGGGFQHTESEDEQHKKKQKADERFVAKLEANEKVVKV